MIAANTLLQGRYLVVRPLGEGGMGAVYEARDQRFGSLVALKQTFAESDVLRKAFQREARLLNSLQHGALPHVIDFFAEGDDLFLVMQYVQGEDFGAMLARRGAPFPIEDVLRWADQLLDALDYLHTQAEPIIHRDIKPQNLKMTARGDIILLDFGLAKGSAGHMTHTADSVLGYTPYYASLEQMRNLGTDASSDLYSLAATLHHLATGQAPPDALSRADVILQGSPDPLLGIYERDRHAPPEIAEILRRAMALKRDERFGSARAMRTALRDAARIAHVSWPGAATPSDPSTAIIPNTEAANRMTVPQQYRTAPEPQAAGPVYQTVPATMSAPVAQPARSGTKIALGLAAVAGFVLLAALAVAGVYLFGVARSRPEAPPSPTAQREPSQTGVPAPPSPVATPPPAPAPVAPPPVAPPPIVAPPPSTVTPQIVASASSARAAINDNSYGPEHVGDRQPATAWVEGAAGPGVGESITLRLSTPARVTRLRIRPGYFKSRKTWETNNRVARARILLSDGRQLAVTFTDEMREQEVAIGGGPVASVTITIEEAYLGGDMLDTAISDIAVDF